MDLYSRRVVGWSIDRRMNKALVIRAFVLVNSNRTLFLETVRS
jgi:transposase InsO family protein